MLRYEHPLGSNLRGYAQFDIAHKGDMWNDLHSEDKNTVCLVSCSRATCIMNLRLGLNPERRPLAHRVLYHQPRGQERDRLQQHRQFRPARTTNEPRVFGLRLNYRFGKETNSE